MKVTYPDISIWCLEIFWHFVSTEQPSVFNGRFLLLPKMEKADKKDKAIGRQVNIFKVKIILDD